MRYFKSNFPTFLIVKLETFLKDFVLGLSILINGSNEEKLAWTFHLYDLDGDGVISREEMEDLAMAVSPCTKVIFFNFSKIIIN